MNPICHRPVTLLLFSMFHRFCVAMVFITEKFPTHLLVVLCQKPCCSTMFDGSPYHTPKKIATLVLFPRCSVVLAYLPTQLGDFWGKCRSIFQQAIKAEYYMSLYVTISFTNPINHIKNIIHESHQSHQKIATLVLFVTFCNPIF